MPCCCVRTLNLCDAPVCGTLELKQAATAGESGVANIYTLVLDYMETAITLVQAQEEGKNIKFNIGKLNENFQYTAQVFNLGGNPVSIVKDGISYDCIKFKTILKLSAETGMATPPVLDIENTVVIEAIVNEQPVVTGTINPVTGIVNGSNIITSDAFIGVRVIVIRGNGPIPGINPGDGSNYFTKLPAADFISLNEFLVPGEFIRIQTIPV